MAAEPDLAEGAREAIRAIRFEAYYRSARKAVPANAIVALAVAGALYTSVALVQLLIWVGAIAVISAMRYLVIQAASRHPENRWLDTGYLGLTAITGALWGAAIFMIPPGEYMMASSLIVFVIAGMTAGASVSAASRPVVAFVYNLPTLGGLAAYFSLQGELLSGIMAALVATYFVVGYRIAKGGETTLNEALTANQALEGSRSRVVSQARALKELARRHEKAAHIAEEATRMKASFLANISHEVRTPLNGILSVTHGLEKDTNLTDAQRTKLATLRESGEMLMRLVGDMLDFSKIEAGRMALVTAPMAVRDLARDTETIWAERAQAKNLKFTVAIESGEDLVLNADAARIKQVLFNLISNSVKYTKAGEIRVRIGVRDEKSSARLRIEVHDTGRGVPREAQGRLFKDYSQLDTDTNQRMDGTGLGLAICRRMVELMNGNIGHFPGRAGGSVFWFDAALTISGTIGAASKPTDREAATPKSSQPETQDQKTTPKQAPAPADATPERPLRVLAAEDNAINRSVLEGFLMSQGWSVDFAENGEEAVEAAQVKAYDVILMDMRMPVMDGLAATRAIRDLATTASMTPIVALTANARPEDEAQCLAAGMDGYVSKPIDAKRLFTTIATAINSESEPQPVAARRA